MSLLDASKRCRNNSVSVMIRRISTWFGMFGKVLVETLTFLLPFVFGVILSLPTQSGGNLNIDTRDLLRKQKWEICLENY